MLLVLVALHAPSSGLAAPFNPRASWRTCSVLDFNATGDGVTFDTEAIDAALSHCADGGEVVLPAGRTFLTAGGHVMTNNTSLQLEAGATLLQTSNLSQGSAFNKSLYCGYQQPAFDAGCAVVSAQNASNVTIRGPGAIQGAGAPSTCWNWDPRPTTSRGAWGAGSGYANLLKFRRVAGLRIDGVALRNPCGWTVHPHECQNVHMSSLSISCTPMQFHYNTDGIDPDSCRDVLIEDVDYSCGDDAVAIKATWPGCTPSKNVTVRRLRSGGRGGLTIGSEVQGGVEDVAFLDSVSTGASGIRISQQAQRGGYIRNATFRNISFSWGTSFAFQKKSFLLDSHQSYAASDGGAVCPGYAPQPTMRGVAFENLTVLGAPPGLVLGDLGCDAAVPPACTGFALNGITIRGAPLAQPLTCSNRPGSQCQGNCSSVHGTIVRVSPPAASKCVLLK